MTDGAAADLVLASASPRRRELLEQLGPGAGGDARRRRRDAPPRRAPGRLRPADRGREVRRGRRRRARPTRRPPPSCRRRRRHHRHRRRPRSWASRPTRTTRAGCCAALAGRRHDVTTAYRIRCGGKTLDRAVTTAVSFRSLQPAELDAYIASGEWQGKAGGYAVQGIARRLRDRAARLAHERHRAAAGRGARRPAGAGGAAALSAAGVRQRGSDDDARRRRSPTGWRACASASRAPSAPPAVPPARSACSRSARRCPPTTSAPRSPPASARSARTTRRSCATSWRCSRTIGRCRRRPSGTSSGRCRATRSSTSPDAWRCCTPSIRPRCWTPIEARGGRQACLIQVNVAGEAAEARRRARRICRRCSIASHR